MAETQEVLMFVWVLVICILVLAVVHSFWWLIAVVPLLVYKIFSWRFYSGEPWRKVYFPLRNTYSVISAKMSAKNKDFPNDEFAFEESLEELIKVAHPEFNSAQVQLYLLNQYKRLEDFEDAPLIENEIRKRVRNDDAKVKRLLDAIDSDNRKGENKHLVDIQMIQAAVIEEKCGKEQRGKFLFAAFTNDI